MAKLARNEGDGGRVSHILLSRTVNVFLSMNFVSSNMSLRSLSLRKLHRRFKLCMPRVQSLVRVRGGGSVGERGVVEDGAGGGVLKAGPAYTSSF